MPDVLAVVEGESEQAFVEAVLAPHLSLRSVHLTARLIGDPGHKGGVHRPWHSVRKEISTLLRSGRGRRVVYVTTMFDYYGMRTDGAHGWPGRAEAVAKNHGDKPSTVEAAIHRDLCASLGESFDPALFFPYVQMHELEALIFTDPRKLSYEFVEEEQAVARLTESVRGVPPEEVNDSPQSAPSKRIIHFIPQYEKAKRRAAAQVLDLIGLAALRAACPHFAAWLGKLESLALTAPSC